MTVNIGMVFDIVLPSRVLTNFHISLELHYGNTICDFQ